MKKCGIFDIMGPIMVGPSSSHTAGAARLALVARKLCLMKYGPITAVTFLLHGSFADTYKGHGTDKALLAGILGFNPDDPRLCESYSLAAGEGLTFKFLPKDLGEVHPNTVQFLLESSGQTMTVTGSSIGGGNIIITEIDGLETAFTGEKPLLITKHRDAPGVVSRITALLYQRQINIGNMRVKRSDDPDGAASMYLELDQPMGDDASLRGLAEAISEFPGVESALLAN